MTTSSPRPPRIAGVLLAAGMGRRFGGPKALADTGSGPWVLRALAALDGLEPRVVVVGAAAEDVAALLPAGVIAARNPDFAGGMGSSLAVGLKALPADYRGGETSGPARPGRGTPNAADARTGAAATGAVDAAVIMLVDLPDVDAAVVDRVVGAALAASEARDTADTDRTAGRTEPGGAAENDVIPVTPDAADGRRPSGGDADRAARRRALRGALARATYAGRPGHPVLIGADHFAGVLEVATGDHGARDYLATHPVTEIECGDLAGGVDVDRRPHT